MKRTPIRTVATIALTTAALAPLSAQDAPATPPITNPPAVDAGTQIGDAVGQRLRGAAGDALRGTAEAISGQPATGQATVGQQQPGQQQPQPRMLQPGQQPDGYQTTQPADQRRGQASQTSDRYEANRPSIGSSQNGIPLPQAMVQKFKKMNEGQIELAKMAASETQNDQVRQFAKQIQQDHQQLNQQLSNWQSQGNAATAYLPQQVIQVGEQAAENCLRMTKEQLRSQKGKNFDLTYVGHQVVAHTAAVAELQALQSQGPQEIRSYVSEALQRTNKHLETAKQLAGQLMN